MNINIMFLKFFKVLCDTHLYSILADLNYANLPRIFRWVERTAFLQKTWIDRHIYLAGNFQF